MRKQIKWRLRRRRNEKEGDERGDLKKERKRGVGERRETEIYYYYYRADTARCQARCQFRARGLLFGEFAHDVASPAKTIGRSLTACSCRFSDREDSLQVHPWPDPIAKDVESQTAR